MTAPPTPRLRPMRPAAREQEQLLPSGRCSRTLWVRPFVEAWSLYRRLQMLPQVYGATALHEVHPAPSADAAADSAAAALEGAVPFVPGRYGAADHSMEEAVKLSHGNGR